MGKVKEAMEKATTTGALKVEYETPEEEKIELKIVTRKLRNKSDDEIAVLIKDQVEKQMTDAGIDINQTVGKEPEDKKPEEKKPEEKKPTEKKPEEKKPVEKKPEEKKPAEKKPEEKKPAEKKPEDKKPADKKPEQKKPAEKKPEEKKPTEKKPVKDEEIIQPTKEP